MGKKRLSVMAVVLIALTMLFVLAGCSNSTPTSQSSNTSDSNATTTSGASGSLLETITKRGTLIVGSTLRFPPQMYKDEKGNPAGYDPTLMKMLADDLGVKLQVEDMDFDSLIPALQAGKVDMLMVGLVNTPKRALSLEFTRPYVNYNQVIVVPTNSTAQGPNDLNQKGKTITALIGSTSENLAKALMPNAAVKGLDQQAAMMEVTSGRADGLVVEEYMAVPLVKNNPNKVKILNPETPFSSESGTIGIRPGDQRWLNYLNTWLNYYDARGTLDQLHFDLVTSKTK